ncbi:MAG: kynureninase, partial [Planctomycetaceae bacterium]|nr:kynureninase [Planctomycetaceae bacterium]
LFIDLVEQRCGGHDVKLVSPRDPERRGSQISFDHQDGYPIVRAMHDRGVVCDYREPANMRFGFAPLYLRFVDVWFAANALVEVIETGAWDHPRFLARAAVT